MNIIRHIRLNDIYLLGNFDYEIYNLINFLHFCSSIFLFIYIENLLNSSKSQNVNGETPTISRPPVRTSCSEQDELLDDRHERTGSVKFADQAEENKEVFINKKKRHK